MNKTASIIYGWWAGVKDDRGVAARLRRAGDLTEVLMEPVTLKLARELGAKPHELPDIALIAGVLAYVKDHTPERVARALGTPEDRPLCSALRFRRLLEASPGEAQLTAFRRTLALLGGKANIYDLADSLLDWNTSARRDGRRQRWLYDYYHTDNPAAGQNEEISA